jgi:hypothetical protein
MAMMTNPNFARYERLVKKFRDHDFKHTQVFSELKFDEVIVHLALADGFTLKRSHGDGNDDGVIRVYRHKARGIWVVVDRWRPQSTYVVVGTDGSFADMAWAVAVLSGLYQVDVPEDIGPGLDTSDKPWQHFMPPDDPF